MTHHFRPDATIEIAGRALSAAEAGLARADVALALGAHGQATLTFWHAGAFADAAEGDALTLTLGPAGGGGPLPALPGGGGGGGATLTGTVAARRAERGAVVIEALDTTGPLARTRIAAVFEDTAIHDIATRLADEAGVDVEADAGGTLAIYYAVPTRPVWDHLRDLAALGGYDLVADGEGTLLFRQPGGATTHTLRFGAELLDWSVAAREAPVAIAAGAHGDGSGSGTWHWVVPDPLGEDPGPARIHGELTDRDGADTASEAGAARAARAAATGHLLLSGSPEIRPGDGIEITDLPGGDPDPLRVRGVRHRLDGRTGFTTVIEIEGGGDVGGLPGGLP